MHLNYPEIMPSTLGSGEKNVSHETGPKCQKRWGLLLSRTVIRHSSLSF